MSTFPSRHNHHRCHEEAENDAGQDAARTKSNRSTTKATLKRPSTPAASDRVTQHRAVTLHDNGHLYFHRNYFKPIKTIEPEAARLPIIVSAAANSTTVIGRPVSARAP
jgi:hypothetical protein